MFGIDTQEEIPRAYLEDHAAWDDYIGHLWYSLLRFYEFSPSRSVIEIGPGASAKIGRALARVDYEGRLYVIDSSQKVIDALKPRYAELLPKARIEWICRPLHACHDAIPQGADFMLSNHIIDDMILSGAQADAPEGERVQDWAAAYTHVPAEKVRECWTLLAKDPARLAAAKRAAGDGILGAIAALAPRHVVFSQYPSSTLYDNGMAGLNESALAVFERLRAAFKTTLADNAAVQAILNANKNYGNEHIGEHVLNAKYWMLCRP
ncbi:MAG: hypothetical protein GC185_10885 [Alphaproteobacteria bacterium]|nr:hypothetical protein [Alphaproteobacteria bacterium]